MGIKQNSLKIIWFLLGILIVPICGDVEVIAIANIGLNLTLPDTGAPSQVPWVGPLPTCPLNVSASSLAGCLEGIVNKVKQSWSFNGGGIPALGIPDMDPCFADKISIKASTPTFEFTANCTNVSLTGFDGLSDVQFSLDTEGNSARFSLTFPSLKSVGSYVANGAYTALFFPVPICGEGEFWMLFDTVTFSGTVSVFTTIVNGTKILQADNINSYFTMKDYAFVFEGIGGVLGAPVINTITYVFRGSIFTSVQPLLSAKSNEILTTILNTFLTTQPYLAEAFRGA